MEKWIVFAKKADFNQIAEKYNISPMLARIIRNKDIIEEKDIACKKNWKDLAKVKSLRRSEADSRIGGFYEDE